jgi:hypothetical protein
MKAYEGMMDRLHSTLTSTRYAADGELYVASALPPWERPSTICIEDWVDSGIIWVLGGEMNLLRLPGLELRILGSLKPSHILYYIILAHC